MTTVFFHAIFRTMDEEKPLVTAVSVRDGRILGTGDQASLCAALDAAGEAYTLCDLNGTYVFPGFIDTCSAAAFDAFDAACREEGVPPEEATAWVKDAVDFITDKGASVICLHGPRGMLGSPTRRALEALEIPEESLIYDVEYRTELEEDGGAYYYEAILGDPNETFLLFNPIYDMHESIHECLRALTCEAAAHIGRDDLGTIAPGKIANFTVFDENLYENGRRAFERSHVLQIYRGGELAYDAEQQAVSDMYDLMLTQFV